MAILLGYNSQFYDSFKHYQHFLQFSVNEQPWTWCICWKANLLTRIFNPVSSAATLFVFCINVLENFLPLADKRANLCRWKIEIEICLQEICKRKKK